MVFNTELTHLGSEGSNLKHIVLRSLLNSKKIIRKNVEKLKFCDNIMALDILHRIKKN